MLLKDLSTAYNKHSAGDAALPATLLIQYPDFAAWQQGLLTARGSSKAADLRQYWQHQLEGCVPVLQLPLAQPRPPAPTHAAGLHTASLGQELLAGVRRLAADLRLSMQAVLLAAVQVCTH